MHRILGLKYPKTSILLFSLVLSYFFFSVFPAEGIIRHAGVVEELSAFVAGIMFAFGFTAPLAAGFFITLNPGNVLVAALFGGAGALLSDLVIFNVIRISFRKEMLKLNNDFKKDKLRNKILKNPLFKKLTSQAKWAITPKIKSYLLYAFAGIAIASPLPDELGIILLAGLTRIKQKKLAVISFALNTLGILALILI
ncbi:MAG: hypothetical protein QXO69_03425 [archaeon]